MKDQFVALTEAVRLARMEFDCYRDRNCKATPEWTIARLSVLLESKDMSEAMAALVPDEELSPSVMPKLHSDANLEVWTPWKPH